MQQQQTVPTLRFPEFNGGWITYSLDNVTLKIQDGTHFSPDTYETEKYPYITSKNIRMGWLDLNDLSYVTEQAHNEIYKRCDVKQNDVLLTKDGASTGNVCINTLEEPFSMLSSVAFLRADTKKVLHQFLFQVIASDIGQREIIRSIAGQAITRITLEKLRNYKFSFPNLAEQKKIAAFLGAVDEKIAQLQKKKDLLEDYKKGCMQKLFSQDLRFTDDNGNPFPDWEEIEIGKFGSVRTSSVDKLSRDGERPAKLLNYMDVYRRDHIKPHDEFQDITAPEGQFTASDLKEGDVLFTPSSETPTDIGHSAVVIKDLPNVLFSYHLMRFRPKKGVLLPSFSGYAFKSYTFYLELWKRAQGATRYTISKSAVEESKVRYPKSLDEQKKIADFLSAIDDKIALVAEELDKAKSFKKGLLQQMFV